MSDVTMPAAEATGVARDERGSYELAFHVLPTVAEGEVAQVYADLKAEIEKAGATVIDEEAPERIDLAYEVEKHYEGKNRRFKSSYFGWVRFQADGEAADAINQFANGMGSILRHLLVKLTRTEEAHPFRYHEAMRAEGTIVTNVGDDSSEVTVEKAETTDTAEADESADKEAETETETEAKEETTSTEA